MFLPPDPRNSVRIPTSDKVMSSGEPKFPGLKIPSTVWPFLAGLSFGSVRFLIGLAFVLWFFEPKRDEPGWSGVADMAWKATIAASVFSAVAGGLMWWLLKVSVAPVRGAGVGALVACLSYVGIAFYALVEAAVWQDEKALDVAVMSLVCSVTSAMITGPFVITGLVLLGIGMGALEKATSPCKLPDGHLSYEK